MRRKTIYSIFVLLIISTLIPAYAGHDAFEGHDHAPKPKADKSVVVSNVSVLPGEAVIIVHGIVCSFCSQGVTRNLSKLKFIDKSKYTKGVKVEIEDQKVTIAIKPGHTLDLLQVYKSILKGGYEPVEAYVSDSDGNVTLHNADDV